MLYFPFGNNFVNITNRISFSKQIKKIIFHYTDLAIQSHLVFFQALAECFLSKANQFFLGRGGRFRLGLRNDILIPELRISFY